MSPIAATAGQPIAVLLTAQGTGFSQNATQASFGDGTTSGQFPLGDAALSTVPVTSTLGQTIVIDSTRAIALIRPLVATPDATARTVTVRTGTQEVSKTSAFQFVSTPQPGNVVTLPNTPLPASGPIAGTSFRLTVPGLPTSALTTAQVRILAQPRAGGAAVTITPSAVSASTGGTRTIDFSFPTTLTVTASTEYVLTLYGTTSSFDNASAFVFCSGNRALVTLTPSVVTPPATISSVQPNSGEQGRTMPVNITGVNTHFAASTQVNFGAQIQVSTVTVNSPTSLTALLIIAPTATPGARTLLVTTGTEQASLTNAFTVTRAPASLLSVSPVTGTVGTNVNLVIVGRNTTFVQGTTQLNLGAGIVIQTITVNTPESLTALVSITVAATPGTRTVTVTTGTESASLANAFTVASAAPILLSVIPPSAQAGSTISVTITGRDTHFSASSQVSLGAGVTVNTVSVNSALSLTVQISLAPSAALGPRTATVTTGVEIVTLPNAFTVLQSAPPPIISITSPPPNTLFSQSGITVIGSVNDSAAQVRVNGVVATVAGGAFTANNVPLHEGHTLLTATATNAAGSASTASVSVILDTTPPVIRLDAPTDGSVVTSSTLTVTGMINDIVSGTVNAPQATVTVNGAPAIVSNRSFLAADVLLVRGLNTITAIAKDRAGNVSQHQVKVTLQDVAGQQRLLMVSGNNQTGVVGTLLPTPLMILALDAKGNPIASLPVTFTVRRSDGIVRSGTQASQKLTLNTDSNGRANVQFQLGTRTGVGMNEVQASAVGFAGEVIFCQSSSIGPATQIKGAGVMGETFTGVAGKPLPMPVEGIVFDQYGNPVANVPVTFRVQQGGGTVDGAVQVVKNSDSDGKVSAVFRLGQQEGIGNNVATASIPNSNAPVVFTASGVIEGPPGNTRVSGVVLDNANTPIPNATAKIVGTPLTAVSNAQGQFTINGAPVGAITLIVDGATSTRSETFPFLAFQMMSFAGQDNTIGMPIFLPPLDTENSRIVGGPNEVVLTMKGVAGVAFTVAPNSATFADNSKVGRLSLSQVHADKVPMPPPYGTSPRIVWTLQPAGVHFDPPIRVQLPNTDSLAAGQAIEVFQFDHDVEQFVSVGTARVASDGALLTSDPGFGITKSGWGASTPPPPPPGCVGSCDDHEVCNGLEFCDPQTGTCRSGPPPSNGASCGRCYTGGQCQNGICAGGQVVNCSDGNFCNGLESCSPGSGCIAGQIPNCNDGNICNGLESCNPASGCRPGATLQCDDGDICNGTESCDPAAGCRAGYPAANGTSCGRCFSGGSCQNGICSGGTPINCDDSNVCNGAEMCDPAVGCRSGTPLSCSDGDVCNGTETCDPILGCRAGVPLSCDDNNPCNGNETCDPIVGCRQGVPLPDGVACNNGGICRSGSCSMGPIQVTFVPSTLSLLRGETSQVLAQVVPVGSAGNVAFSSADSRVSVSTISTSQGSTFDSVSLRVTNQTSVTNPGTGSSVVSVDATGPNAQPVQALPVGLKKFFGETVPEFLNEQWSNLQSTARKEFNKTPTYCAEGIADFFVAEIRKRAVITIEDDFRPQALQLFTTGIRDAALPLCTGVISNAAEHVGLQLNNVVNGPPASTAASAPVDVNTKLGLVELKPTLSLNFQGFTVKGLPSFGFKPSGLTGPFQPGAFTLNNVNLSLQARYNFSPDAQGTMIVDSNFSITDANDVKTEGSVRFNLTYRFGLPSP